MPLSQNGATGFRVTGYDGKEVWKLLHDMATKKNVADFMVFFHNVVNFGLGKPVYGTTIDQFHKDVLRPDLMPVASVMRHGSVMEDVRRAVVAIIAKDERLHCPHCRSHGLKWFHAICDLVRVQRGTNEQTAANAMSFYRPAGMLHFIGPYRAYCRLLQQAVASAAHKIPPPPDVRPCAMNSTSKPNYVVERRGHKRQQRETHAHTRAGPEQPEERPASPMVGVAPAVPRPLSPSRQSGCVEASEWRVLQPQPSRTEKRKPAKRARRSLSSSPTQEADGTTTESDESESDSDTEADDDEETQTSVSHKTGWDSLGGSKNKKDINTPTAPAMDVSVPVNPPAVQKPEPVAKKQVRAAAAIGVNWL